MINPLECTQGLPRNQSPYESTLRVKRREPMQSQRNNACGAFDAPCIYTVLTIHKTYIGNNVATMLQTLGSYRNVRSNTLQQQRCLMIQDRVLHDYDGVLHDNDGVLHDSLLHHDHQALLVHDTVLRQQLSLPKTKYCW